MVSQIPYWVLSDLPSSSYLGVLEACLSLGVDGRRCRRYPSTGEAIAGEEKNRIYLITRTYHFEENEVTVYSNGIGMFLEPMVFEGKT